jgi:signal transduction histidine kinase
LEIKVESALSGGLWKISAEPNQLENALLNLAANARDAMPITGKLTIETANTYFGPAMPC